MSIWRAVLVGTALLTVFLLVETGHAQAQGCRLVGYSPPPISELPIGPRAAAMGGVTNGAASPSSHVLYSNPSRLAATDASRQAAAGYLNWIGDVSVMTASGAVTSGAPAARALGAGVTHARYSTAYPAAEPCRGRQASAAGLTVGGASRTTDQLTWGVAAQYLQQRETLLAVGHGFDVNGGLTYETGLKSLVAQLSGRNLLGGMNQLMGLGPYYRGGGSEVNMPFAVRGGVGMNVLDLIESRSAAAHRLWMATDIGIHERLGSTLRLGSEYSWKETLMLRTGYVFTGKRRYSRRMPLTTSISSLGLQTVGLGLRHQLGTLDLQLDYAFGYRERYDNDHRLAVSARF